jgi:hypothetical protein
MKMHGLKNNKFLSIPLTFYLGFSNESFKGVLLVLNVSADFTAATVSVAASCERTKTLETFHSRFDYELDRHARHNHTSISLSPEACFMMAMSHYRAFYSALCNQHWPEVVLCTAFRQH